MAKLASALPPQQAESVLATGFASRINRHGPGAVSESAPLRLAWALTNIWLLFVLHRGEPTTATFEEAQEWFYGRRALRLPSITRIIPSSIAAEAIGMLRGLFPDEDLRTLLPYVLEPHGSVHRLNALRDREAAEARRAKRLTGVFYTPSDVADFMSREVMSAFDPHRTPDLVIDPACGTGVFLLALARQIVARKLNGHANTIRSWMTHLFGVDASALAVESCTFCALDACLADPIAAALDPWALWHVLRLNLAVCDATRLGPPSGRPHRNATLRIDMLRDALLDTTSIELHGESEVLDREEQGRLDGLFEVGGQFQTIDRLFPEASLGFDVLITNPPYSKVPSNGASLARLGCDTRELLDGARSLYPAFIQMMWRLTNRDKGASSVVVPLSIAFSQDDALRRTRRGLSTAGGAVSFRFFDREPHGLFGEEVKTRAAIIVRSRCFDHHAGNARISTTTLQKSTSRTRANLFKFNAGVDLGAMSIEAGIPRLGSEMQKAVFVELQKRRSLLKHGSARLARGLPYSFKSDDTHVVFVGPTAYNFINVLLGAAPACPADQLPSDNPYTVVELSSSAKANIVFALLSSRLAYWLWTVVGDGFHVSRAFAADFPINCNDLSERHQAALCSEGASFWRSVLDHKITSVNGGKCSIAYSPIPVDDQRDEIDSIILEALHIPKEFLSELRDLVEERVVVDRTDPTRLHLYPARRSPNVD